MKKIFIILAGMIVTGCDAIMGEEVARFPMELSEDDALSVEELQLALKKGDNLAFWTEMDVEFENELELVYVVGVWKDSVKQGEYKLDALKTNPRMMEVKTTFGNKTSWSYTGKMDNLEVPDDGIYHFKMVLMSSGNPTLSLKKAELVLKK